MQGSARRERSQIIRSARGVCHGHAYVVAASTPEKLDTKNSSLGGCGGKPGGGGPGEGDAYGEPWRLTLEFDGVSTGGSNATDGLFG